MNFGCILAAFWPQNLLLFHIILWREIQTQLGSHQLFSFLTVIVLIFRSILNFFWVKMHHSLAYLTLHTGNQKKEESSHKDLKIWKIFTPDFKLKIRLVLLLNEEIFMRALLRFLDPSLSFQRNYCFLENVNRTLLAEC